MEPIMESFDSVFLLVEVCPEIRNTSHFRFLERYSVTLDITSDKKKKKRNRGEKRKEGKRGKSDSAA